MAAVVVVVVAAVLVVVVKKGDLERTLVGATDVGLMLGFVMGEIKGG